MFHDLQIACVFVAALLHYLFTAVFFWMLCEGIMLYLMLVFVFNRISKKWWIFLIIGWGKLKISFFYFTRSMHILLCTWMHNYSTVYLLIYRTLLILPRTLFWEIFVVLIQWTLQCFNITFVLNIRTISWKVEFHS